jgi:acyl-CoA thioesterase-1
MFRLLLFAVMFIPAVSVAERPPLILLVGDSLSAAYGLAPEDGWVSLLGRRLTEKGYPHQVVNASVSGETTAGGLTRLPTLLERHRPALVVIQLGANDGLRGFAFDETRANLAGMIGNAREADARVLLVGIRLPPNYGAAYTERFQAIFRAVAEREGVELAPRLLGGVAEDRALMQPDGLHPTADAQPMLLENIWPVLERLLTESALPSG